MALPIRWLNQADQELAEIWQYVSQDSPTNAGQIVVRLVQAARDLGQYPRSGHVVPEFDLDDIREYPVWPFRLVYQVTDEQIIILAIVHGARQMPRDIAERNT